MVELRDRVFQPTWGTFRLGEVNFLTFRGMTPRHGVSFSSECSQRSCIPTQTPRKGCFRVGIRVWSPLSRRLRIAEDASP